MTSLNVITYNVKGMQQNAKRNKIFNYVNDKIGSGIVFFQECHSTPECEANWRKSWDGKMFFSHGSSNSTGCAIAFSKGLNIDINEDKISTDDNGRIIIIEATLDSKKFLLINLYNANTEKEQLVVLDTLCKLLKNHDPDDSFHPIFSGDFNVIFDTVLDASGGNPTLKKKSIAKIVSITEKLYTCDTFELDTQICGVLHLGGKTPPFNVDSIISFFLITYRNVSLRSIHFQPL